MPEAHFETFLDRLMRAESNGRDFAANPRSTALGPFQFIKATFLDVARRHFAEVASLSDEEVLALRTDRAYARRAAAIYSMENLAYLTGRGLKPALGDLRLAYLVGPTAAARLMQAHPQTPASDILGAPVVRANPFMAGMSASELIARSARDVGEHHRTNVAMAPEPRRRTVGIQPGPRAQPRPGPLRYRNLQPEARGLPALDCHAGQQAAGGPAAGRRPHARPRAAARLGKETTVQACERAGSVQRRSLTRPGAGASVRDRPSARPGRRRTRSRP